MVMPKKKNSDVEVKNMQTVTKTTYSDAPRWQNVSSLDVLRDIHGFTGGAFQSLNYIYTLT